MPAEKKSNPAKSLIEIDSPKNELPLLPLRDVVIYPHMVIPLFVGREKSIYAMEVAMTQNKEVFLVAQKSASEDEPSPDDLFQIGCIATILQLLKLPDGTVKVLVEGARRARLEKFCEYDSHHAALVKPLSDELVDNEKGEREIEILVRTVINEFEQYLKMNKKLPMEILSSLATIDDPSRLADTIAAHLSLKIEPKQELLEFSSVKARLEKLMVVIEGEIELFRVEKRIQGQVRRQMEKTQREYYLNEQMKAIQRELGNQPEEDGNEITLLTNKIKEAGMPAEVDKKAQTELGKLKMMSPMSAEATVLRNYLDWLISVPWKKRSRISRDLIKAEQILAEDHYGLKEVKERILEYLAVEQRVKKLKGQVLCLVGPPGVGKTSLGQSIARATGRKYVRVSLGGVRDEAEIRGHRRTYIGSLPGKIIQKLAKVEVRNPLFLLDELDKMAADFRGDPASALLEVLDPEQNHTFNDHYLEVDYDLSDVMFIATANTLNIPGPLLDRMEVIRLPGYTEDEKVNIAIKHLMPKQLKQNGLHKKEFSITETVIIEIIRYYTREAGVRNLERQLSKLCRKIVKEVLTDKKVKHVAVTVRNLEKYLGVKQYRYGIAEEHDQVGQVTGLAWTEVGGELLSIEATAVTGKGKANFTGQLGDIMQESIQAALTVVRSRARNLGIKANFYEKLDIHIHVPEGATPKDGPSAGIAMCTALVSVLTKIPVLADVAMTGEITLRGEVLPIGGLKEKLLAAHRGGIKQVIIPYENRKDLKEIPDNIKSDLDIHPVRWIDEVLDLALQQAPTPNKEADGDSLSAATPTTPRKKRSSSSTGSRRRTH